VRIVLLTTKPDALALLGSSVIIRRSAASLISMAAIEPSAFGVKSL
jgi:hypothetical protein